MAVKHFDFPPLNNGSFTLLSIVCAKTARDVCPCIWITSPEETTYILKTILRLAGVSLHQDDLYDEIEGSTSTADDDKSEKADNKEITVNLKTVASRNAMMDVYTGEMLSQS